MDRKPRPSSRFKYPAVTEVAEVLALAPPALPWRNEAPARHRIRVLLVLQGMAWERTDWLGHSLVARARNERGVRQPRGWDSDADLSQWLPDFDNPRVVCGRPYGRLFVGQDCCGTKCMNRRAEIEAWSIARVGAVGPPRCRFCFNYFEPDNPLQQFCGPRCLDHRR
jgi:hypothetical protein